MRARLFFLLPVSAALILLSGCDHYSLLDSFDRTGGLSLTAASASLGQGGSTGLYAAGGKPPYSWQLVEKDLVYIDSGNRLGAMAGTVYTAGNSIGTVTIRVRDSAGNTVAADIAILPPPPVGLTVSPAGVNALALAWTVYANPAHISAIAVYRSKTGAPYTEAAILGSGTATYTDSPLSPNTEYTYYLQAVNGAYRSRPTEKITNTTD